MELYSSLACLPSFEWKGVAKAKGQRERKRSDYALSPSTQYWESPSVCSFSLVLPFAIAHSGRHGRSVQWKKKNASKQANVERRES
jgi:hypothetical protein